MRPDKYGDPKVDKSKLVVPVKDPWISSLSCTKETPFI